MDMSARFFVSVGQFLGVKRMNSLRTLWKYEFIVIKLIFLISY